MQQHEDRLARADSSDVARARESFLSNDEIDVQVRRTVLASWQRSRESQVNADQIIVPYTADRDSTNPLVVCAAPVLDKLHEQLEDEPVSILLTDRSGVVLDRRTTSRELCARLDLVSLAPGFSYAEQHAGTNGIGTTVSSGRPTFIDGREHYTHPLGQFACAGAPIHHPTKRTTLGVLDLTSWAHSRGSMLMALAKATAYQIEQELLAQNGVRELALFAEYMRACQQSGAAVLAINPDVVMLNEHLRVVLDAAEQRALIDHAAAMLPCPDRGAMRAVQLPSGRSAHLRCVPVSSEAGSAGAVFRIRLVHSDLQVPVGAAVIRGIRSSLSPPGLVGSAPSWIRCVQQVNSRYEAGDSLALSGEPGTGKRALLRAVHLLHNPTHGVRVLDPPTPNRIESWHADLVDALSTPTTLVIIPHAESLDSEASALLATELLEVVSDDDPDRRTRVAITSSTPDLAHDMLAAAFPRTIEVPSLRHHIDDLGELVPRLLTDLTGHNRLAMSEAAIAQLKRLNWPGNVAQLRDLLAQVVRRRHSGMIEIDDLPPAARASGHRRLTPIEAMERDAIVQALLDNDEKPAKAAAALGLSRATIYRKLHQFGIALPLLTEGRP